MRKFIGTFAIVMLSASLGWAQSEPAPPPAPAGPQVTVRTGGESGNVIYRREGPGGKMWIQRGGMGMMGPDFGRGGLERKWWNNHELAKKLGLTDVQIKKMESIFQNHRLLLIDLHANLERQEVILEPMINADQPDEQQVLAQIDKVAQARAELEKSNARMLFAIRKVLTPEQWKQLKSERASQQEGQVRIFRERTVRPGPNMMPPPPPDPPSAPDE